MEDHVVLDVERLASSAEAGTLDSCHGEELSTNTNNNNNNNNSVESNGTRRLVTRALQMSAQSEEEHVMVMPVVNQEVEEFDTSGVYVKDKSADSFTGINVECRICQEEDDVANLEVPCACSGSVKYAHRKCVQRWCNEKGDTTCEICQKPYQPGYTAPPRPPQTEGIPIDLSGNWGITGPHQLDLRDPRILAMAAERHFLDSDYDEYASANASSAACCRSAALILMALLLLRHALAMAASGAADDTSTLFTLFLLRAAGFLLPCYIMLRAIGILQRRRQQQEATMAEVAILIQAGQAARNVRFPTPGATAVVAATPAPPGPGTAIPVPTVSP